MIGEKEIIKLVKTNSTKIVLVVMDGVGDIPDESGMTALEAAKTPNLDLLAEKSNFGQTIPVDYGITPGSGPSHLALFGYDPLKHEIGRGVLEALGIGEGLTSNDLAARANFATRSEDGIILDRRAARIPTEENERLCAILSGKIKKIDDVNVRIFPGKEHRFVVIFSGNELYDGLLDADPEETGKPEKFIEATDENSKKAMDIANKFIVQVQDVLKEEHPANTCLLRGLAKSPKLLTFSELFQLKACAIASYPMYKGLARLVGMEVIEGLSTLEEEIKKAVELYDKYDFFYIHVKKTDSYGEDGNRENKVKVIEEFDGLLPSLIELNPDVLCITSDHSTPTPLSGHSWHPNPLLIHGKFQRKEKTERFTENACSSGVYGTIYSKNVMSLLLAQSGRLKKFGA